MTTRLGSEWANTTVSHGTMREEDLIPAFLAVLETVDARAATSWRTEYEETCDPTYDRYLADETRADICHELFDALDERAPEGCYFGAIEGDGSDYGFWQIEED